MIEATGSTIQFPSESVPDADFIRTALKRFQLVADAESRLRREALDDLEFRTGEQWPSDVKVARDADHRPCLTMNRIPSFLRQVINEQRQQRPAVQINPVGDGADIETAEIFEGIIRHIETVSRAEVAYDHAFEMMTTIGFGYWRIIVQEQRNGFGKEIRIEWIKNPFTVYYDPTYRQPDGSDAQWAFIVADLTPERYKNKFRNSRLASSMNQFFTVGDHPHDWINKEFIRIAEYFYLEDEEVTIVLTDDDRVYDKGSQPEGVKIVEQRKIQRPLCKWGIINAIEKLEGFSDDGLGSFIPIVPVFGDDLDVDGKRYLAGMVRSAKDPQRMYNYQISAATEASALQPKAPYMVVEGQIEGHEPQWKEANIRNFAYLEYKSVDVAGKPAPVPQRQSSDTQLQSYAYLIRQADNDLKATTGIYDASLGEKGPDQSGRAILARQKQGDVANLNWTDNLARSISYSGLQLIDLIPRFLSKTQIQRIINPDRTVKHVAVGNSKLADEALQAPNGFDRVYDLGTGIYDVSVTVGPSYQSKRQEGVASKLALVNAFPQIMTVAGDLVVRDMDWPGSEQIAERMYKALPPQMQDAASQDPKVQLANAQTSMQQLQQQLQQAQQLLQQQHEIITKDQIRVAAEMQRAQIQAETQIAVAKINASKDMDKANADRLFAELEMAAGHAHEQAMQASAPTPQQGQGSAPPPSNGQGQGANQEVTQ